MAAVHTRAALLLLKFLQALLQTRRSLLGPFVALRGQACAIFAHTQARPGQVVMLLQQ